MKSRLIRELLAGPWLSDGDPITSSKKFAVELEDRLQQFFEKEMVGDQWDFLKRTETALDSLRTAGCFLVEGPLRLVQGKKTQLEKDFISILLEMKCKSKSLVANLKGSPYRKLAKSAWHRHKVETIRKAIAQRTVSWETRLSSVSRLGVSLEERVVEIPLAWEILQPDAPLHVLDAGAALAQDYIKDLMDRPNLTVTHFTQTPDGICLDAREGRHSYVFGDLRQIDFQPETFDRVVCVSTLEHVGFNNARYGGEIENSPRSFLDAFRELLRVTKRTGQVMVSFPYGIPKTHEWFQVLGPRDVELLKTIGKDWKVEEKFYYFNDFWVEGSENVENSINAGIDLQEKLTGVVALRFFGKTPVA
jgi:hypothetical protein